VAPGILLNQNFQPDGCSLRFATDISIFSPETLATVLRFPNRLWIKYFALLSNLLNQGRLPMMPEGNLSVALGKWVRVLGIKA
jgi:hypothetical protein